MDLPDIALEAIGAELLRRQMAIKLAKPALPGMTRNLSMDPSSAAEAEAYSRAIGYAYAITRAQNRAAAVRAREVDRMMQRLAEKVKRR